MRKSILLSILFLSISLYGCSANNESNKQQTEYAEINQVTQDDSETEKIENVEEDTDDQTAPELIAPTKEEVLAMREHVLEGMSAEEIENLTENIKSANLSLEHAYLWNNIFTILADKESLYWNCFHEKGFIQIGWAYDGELDMKKIMKEEGLSETEFYEKYGAPVCKYNYSTAEDFIVLLEDIKATVQNQDLQNDIQQIIDETALAAETHEMEHVNNMYKILHDMDYYLLRYGPEDVGKYTRDNSTLLKYYGVLTIYTNASENQDDIKSDGKDTNSDDIEDVNEAWQDAYKDIIRDRESYLVDPNNHRLKYGFNGNFYVGVHDFDNNGIPELILGDYISAAIFTYEDGKTEKVVDLAYDQDEWGGINRLSYKNNCIVIESHGNGSGDAPGGNGYVCFTYEQGEYISGFYCDYEPEEATINEKPVSEEEFRKQFNLTELRENSKIEYSKINEDNEITFAGYDESIAIEELDLNLIEW